MPNPNNSLLKANLGWMQLFHKMRSCSCLEKQPSTASQSHPKTPSHFTNLVKSCSTFGGTKQAVSSFYFFKAEETLEKPQQIEPKTKGSHV